MSNARQETVVDIVAQMRQDIADGTVGIWADFGGEVASGYADRIEKAYKRLSLPTPEQWTEIARQSVEIYDLKRENAILRAALKPVLDIMMDMYTSDLSMDMAINEAKRIYWSSSAKGKGGD